MKSGLPESENHIFSVSVMPAPHDANVKYLTPRLYMFHDTGMAMDFPSLLCALN